MWRYSLGLLLGGLLCGVAVAQPPPDYKLVSGNWTIKNDTTKSADDFHVTAKTKGSTALQVGNDFYNDGFFDTKSAVPSALSGTDLTLQLDWYHTTGTPISIVPGESIHIGYNFQSTNTDISITDAYWTYTGTGSGDPPPIEHFRIFSGKSPTLPGFTIKSFHLQNASGESMTLADLQFRIDGSPLPLAALMPYTLGGFGTADGLGISVPTFTIPDGGSVEVTSFLPAGVSDTQFLLYQFHAYPTGFPLDVTAGMFQIQGPIPVPEPGAVASFCLVLAAAFLRRRARP